MVAFLKKPNESVGFTEVVDFLKVASIDSKEYIITEASVRSKLKLADATGIHNLSDAEIYDRLATLGYVTEGDIIPILPAMLAGAAVDQGIDGLVPSLVTRVASLEKELKETKQTLGNAMVKLVKKVKSLEIALKRKSKKVIVSESESEEPEDQRRIIQDIDDDPLVYLVRESMKEKPTYFGVSKDKSIDKGKRYRRRARSVAKNINIGLDAEEEINTGIKDVNTGSIEDVNTGSSKVDTGRTSISTSSIVHSLKNGQREGKAQMVEEDIQATHKTKEQIRQVEAGLEEAIRLQAQMDEEVAKQIHLDKMLAKRVQEEQKLSEKQLKMKAEVQKAAQFYTEEDWDTIRAKLEANTEMRQYIAITDHILWDIITNGNQTTTDPASPSVSAPKTSLAANARRNNEKALNILLSAIPDRHHSQDAVIAKYQENRANGRQEKKIVAIEDSNSKALVATDNNEDIDWTKEFDAEPVTFAMMALTGVDEDDWSMEIDSEPMHFDQDGFGDFDWSNTADDVPVSLALMATNSEVPYCSKCSKSYKLLLENYQKERDNFQKARTEILGYQMSLESLEVILKTHEKNEYAWGDKSRVPQAVLSRSTDGPYYPRMDNRRPRISSYSPSSMSSNPRTTYRPQRPKKIVKSIWVKKGSTVGSQAVLPQTIGNPEEDLKDYAIIDSIVDKICCKAQMLEVVYAQKNGHVNLKNINKLVQGNLVRGFTFQDIQD
ncbi:hypothetical protein Tco_0327837 [Tanacetum coccineum]